MVSIIRVKSVALTSLTPFLLHQIENRLKLKVLMCKHSSYHNFYKTPKFSQGVVRVTNGYRMGQSNSTSISYITYQFLLLQLPYQPTLAYLEIFP